jgi:Big-like domain-containing protein/HYDIN/CFA65/VesB family protein
MAGFLSADRRSGRIWRLLIGLQVSLLVFSLVAPIGTIAATIQTDLFIYNDGDTVTVSGVEFGPSETVDVVTTDPAGHEVDRGTAETDNAGSFSYAFTLRATLAGLYDVVATGSASGLTSATQFDPPPPVPVNLRFVDARSTTGGVTLTWDRVTSSTDCYELYRSTSPLPARPGSTGDFVCGSPPAPTGNLLATIPQPGSGPVSFVDSAAVAGTTYYYYVTALKQGNNQGESAASDQVSTPSLNTAPTGKNFGNQSVGVASAAQSFTVTNNGLATITFRSITKSGTNQADFAVTGTPAAGTNVAVGNSFTFSVTFTPAATGARAATLSVNASDPTHSVPTIFNSRLIGVSGTGVSANTAPVAQNGTLTTNEDTTASGTLVATDADGNALTYGIVANGTHGTVAVANASTGAYTYAPDANYCGPDSFTFRANDGTADSNIATVSVTVTCVNDPPSAVNDTLTVAEDANTTSVSVLTNDTDPDSDTLSVTAAGPASHGTVGFTATTATYKPDPNYCGSDSFSYTISDSHGGTDSATVNVTVTCVNDAPQAQDDSLTTNEDTTGTGTLVATDVESDPLTYSIVANGSHGTATVTNAATGAYKYEPAADYCGADSFTFKANDGDLDSNVATISVAVTCVNDPPVTSISGGPAIVNEDNTTAVTYTFTVTDVDSSSFTVVAGYPLCNDSGPVATNLVLTASGGTFDCLFADGPADQTLSIQVDDGDGAQSSVATKDVHVDNVAPTISPSGAAHVNEGSAYSLTLGAVTDPGTDTVSSYVVRWGDGSSDTYSTNVGAKTHTYADGPAGETITVDLVDEDGTFLAAGGTSVTVDNVAPTISPSGAAHVNEGSAYSLTLGAVTDPGTDTVSSYVVHWGDGSSDTYSTNVGAKTHTYADGPAGETITVDLVDEDGTFLAAGGTSVTVDNVAPTATFSNDGPVAEGSAAAISFAAPSDPSSADTTAGFHYSYACAGGAAALATTYAAASTSATSSCTYGDNGSETVYGRIFDKDNGYTTYSTTVAVTNVNPTTNTPTFTFNPFTGVANATINFSDPGWLDTHTAVFFWGDGSSTDGVPGGSEQLPPDATGSFSGSYTYVVGCVANQPRVVVTDDDGGSVTYTYAGGLDHYAVAFQAPIQDGVRNIVKQGNVIPVKLQITNCSGQPVLGKTLSIGYVEGDVYDDADNGTLTVVDSVSNADTTGFMRYVDSKYMYNLATKSLKVSMPYTVVVREPSTNQFVASFVIYAKK